MNKEKDANSQSPATEQNLKVLSLELLDDFPKHPYGIRDDSILSMERSVKEYGILQPLLVRPKENGRFEIISGRRRKAMAVKAEIKVVPVIIKDMDDDQAIISIVESNIYREKTLPSERAKSYKMWIDAMKRQGKRTDLTSVEIQQKLKNKTSRKILSERTGIIEDKIWGYIKLNDLISDILEIVDNSVIKDPMKLEMAATVGRKIAFLSLIEQDSLLRAMNENHATPSPSQAKRLKEQSQKLKKMNPPKNLSLADIFEIMAEEKPNQKETLKFNHKQFSQIRKYFPRTATTAKIQADIIEGLQLLHEKRQRIAKKSKGGIAR